jgi:hypothetical protein
VRALRFSCAKTWLDNRGGEGWRRGEAGRNGAVWRAGDGERCGGDRRGELIKEMRQNRLLVDRP